MGKLDMMPEQDGYGFYYGTYITDENRIVRVNIMPPKTEPKPHFISGEMFNQHDTEWVLYLDNEVTTHLKSKDQLTKIDIDQFLKPK